MSPFPWTKPDGAPRPATVPKPRTPGKPPKPSKPAKPPKGASRMNRRLRDALTLGLAQNAILAGLVLIASGVPTW